MPRTRRKYLVTLRKGLTTKQVKIDATSALEAGQEAIAKYTLPKAEFIVTGIRLIE
jgi:hypothetical protein